MVAVSSLADDTWPAPERLRSSGSSGKVLDAANISKDELLERCATCRRIQYKSETIAAENASLASDDSEPWARKTVLCIDGAGLHGISTLLILRELGIKIHEQEQSLEPKADRSTDSPLFNGTMKSAQETDKPTASSRFLLCHYFDYIAGSSVGGLIAIMLGRLRMSVDDALNQYLSVEAELFRRRRRSKIVKIFVDQKLALQIRNMRPALSSPEEKQDHFQSDTVRCRTIVCSLSGSHKGVLTPFLFRTYEQQQTKYYKTWELARATTAAPILFKSLTIGGHKYVDGGVGLNNPSIEVFKEVDQNHHRPETHESVDLFLSLGSGLSLTPPIFATSKYKKRRSNVSSITESANAVHEMMQKEKSVFYYYRLEAKVDQPQNVDKSDQTVTDRIKQSTKAYLESSYVQDQLRQCAKLLVSRRRQRSETMRWESFALGTKYRCKYEKGSCRLMGADGKPKVFKTRNDLLDHLREFHRMAPPSSENHEDIKTLLDKGRTNSAESAKSDSSYT